MVNHGKSVRTGLLVAFSLLFLFGTAAPSLATGNIVKSDLKGTWRIELHGLTDCGFASMLATITVGTNGTGTGPLQTHGVCGDSTLPGQTFTVDTLSKTGEGTASLTCGASCEWNFEIQVAPDRTKFNLVDVDPLDTSAFLEGMAILTSPADNVVTADMKGDWQVTLSGRLADCRGVSAVATFALNTAGSGEATLTRDTADCGLLTLTKTFTILGLNADGSGTASLTCGFSGCPFTFEIQVSPDRSIFNLVTASANPGNFIAGVAIRRSTAGHIVKTNLAGSWQATIHNVDLSDDVEGLLLTFKLNAKALSNSVTLVSHGTDDDFTLTDNVLTVQTLNPDGSGTARLSPSCAECEPIDLRIQVSPDRSIISLVEVTPDNEFASGTAIHQ
jgi:hypothetical protein